MDHTVPRHRKVQSPIRQRKGARDGDLQKLLGYGNTKLASRGFGEQCSQ
jgi:hypothetical protein